MRILSIAFLSSSVLLLPAVSALGDPVTAVPAGIGSAPMVSSPGIGVEPQPVADKTSLICRKMDPPTGIRVGTRDVCLTQHQWDMQMHQSQTNVAAAQRKAAQ